MNNKTTEITTNEVRISYEHLLQPYSQQGGEPKYSVTLLIPKSDFATKQRIDAAIQAAMQEGVSGKWGGTRPPQPGIPVWDGDGVRQKSGDPFPPECKGHWVLTASSKQKQEIVDANLNPIIDATEIYSGMYARVNIRFFAYNSNGNKGIGCGLGPIQKLRDGEPLGGHVSAAEAFGGAPAAYPGYAQPIAPQAPPVYPGYAQPQAPTYPQQAPNYAPPVQPQYPQPPYAPPAPVQPAIDPITGQPVAPVYGL